MTTLRCPTCGEATEEVKGGVLYRKDRLLSRGPNDRCETCGSATPESRRRGVVDFWIADSVGTH